jgi:ribosomal protein S6--L-glutamate ligase
MQNIRNWMIILRIAILLRYPNLYSTFRLVEVDIVLGRHVDVIDTIHCYMNVTSNLPFVRYNGKPLLYCDAVKPRIGESVTFIAAV